MSAIKLVTAVPFPEAEVKIGFGRPVLFLGSCFSVHMAKEMESCGIPVWSDPFGISFNPVSIAENLQFCLEGKEIQASELFQQDERFRHFRFHSSASGIDREATCEHMNASLSEFKTVIKEASHLFVTFGTAWAFLKDGQVVNNCHKLPSEQFQRSLLSVNEIVVAWEPVLSMLTELNPELQIAFSLSPVRHWKDGPEGNSLSKAVLRLAIEAILTKTENVSYVPSYEFMMDECRDYRFYADDLLHPSSLAISMIWERLSSAYLDQSQKEMFKRFLELDKREAHRPMSLGTESVQRFEEQTRALRASLIEDVGLKRWTLPGKT